MKPVIIGIMGGSAAGKTTLAHQLADSLAGFSPVILNQDLYFRDFSEYEPDERDRIITSNHPSAILWSSLIEHLSLLSNRQPIQLPVSGSRSLSSKQKLTTISASDLVILECHLIFWHQQIRDLLQIKIYLDVDPHERVLRRLLRSADTPNFDLKWHTSQDSSGGQSTYFITGDSFSMSQNSKEEVDRVKINLEFPGGLSFTSGGGNKHPAFAEFQITLEYKSDASDGTFTKELMIGRNYGGTDFITSVPAWNQLMETQRDVLYSGGGSRQSNGVVSKTNQKN